MKNDLIPKTISYEVFLIDQIKSTFCEHDSSIFLEEIKDKIPTVDRVPKHLWHKNNTPIKNCNMHSNTYPQRK